MKSIIVVMVTLLCLVSVLGAIGLSSQPQNKLVVIDETGVRADSLELYGYYSIHSMAVEYRIRFYEKNGYQAERKYPNATFYLEN